MSYNQISDEDWEPMQSMAVELSHLVSENVGDDYSGPSIEERELRESFHAQLGLLERKYGPHPWLIDIQADASDDPKEKVRLRLYGLTLVEEHEFDLRGQFYADLVRDYLDGSGGRKEAAHWLGKAIELSQKLCDQSLIQEIRELEREFRART